MGREKWLRPPAFKLLYKTSGLLKVVSGRESFKEIDKTFNFLHVVP